MVTPADLGPDQPGGAPTNSKAATTHLDELRQREAYKNKTKNHFQNISNTQLKDITLLY